MSGNWRPVDLTPWARVLELEIEIDRLRAALDRAVAELNRIEGNGYPVYQPHDFMSGVNFDG